MKNLNSKKIFEELPFGVVMIDKAFLIHYSNTNFEKLFELEPDESLGKNIYNLIHKTGGKGDIPILDNSVQHLKAQTDEIYIEKIKKNITLTAIPCINKSNTLESVLISFNDITEQKVKQHKYLEANQKYRKFIEVSPDGIAQFDLVGNITYISPKSVELFGLKNAEEAIGTNVLNYIVEEEHKKAKVNFQESVNDTKSNCYRYTALKKDRSIFYVEINTIRLHDNNCKVYGLLAFIRDVSDKVEAEKALRRQNEQLKSAKAKAEESDRLKSAFLANMSHEIRTPMNGIIGFSNLLMKKSVTEAQRKKYAEIIDKRSKDLLSLINDILDISKIEAGQVELEKAPFSPERLINDYSLIYKHQLKNSGKNIEFAVSTDANVGDIWGDETRLKQVLTNLIDNSIKYTVKGEIEVGFYRHENTVLFFVKDTGIGIPQSKQDLIFERFRQVDESLTRKYGGTGLGLSISKRLVNLMGGEIFVESKIGKGSVFSFTIPYEPLKLKANVESDNKNAMETLLKKRLLIVEDDLVSREYLKEIFELSELEFEETDSGKKAVELIQNNDFDIVLMDIQLPDLNGLEATKKIRKFNKEVVIIAQTAYAMDTDRIKCMEAGCSDYISKPIDMELLMKKIKTFFPDS